MSETDGEKQSRTRPSSELEQAGSVSREQADGRAYASELEVQHRSVLRFLTPTARALVEARRPICAGCSQNKRLGQVTVRCEATGCAGVSLIHGRCKRRKWPAPTPAPPATPGETAATDPTPASRPGT